MQKKCNTKFKNYVQKCAIAKVFALIFNLTIYEKILMPTGTLHLILLKICYYIPGSQKGLTMLNGPRLTLSSIKCINVNCAQGKFLILNWFSSSYVFSTLCISFKSLEKNVSYLEKKILHSVQNSNAPEKAEFKTQHIRGIKETT